MNYHMITIFPHELPILHYVLHELSFRYQNLPSVSQIRYVSEQYL
jgi:hypothetical protein